MKFREYQTEIISKGKKVIRQHGFVYLAMEVRTGKTLTSLGLSPIPHSFPDHYQFNEEDLDFGDSLPIIMTEKDAVRCLEMTNNNLWYLSVEAKFENEELADQILNKLNIN